LEENNLAEVVSVKFKNRGKTYYFEPGPLAVPDGVDVIVDTSKGLELAHCVRGNHEVEDKYVVQPLRPVVRIATESDLRVAEINKAREAEAFAICQKKIAEHGLDMKLVDVECNFEGNKTMFFFTSDGRVDFRELVKDLASVFRNRIELRQIGVRDETKMLGGIGICGRPVCCNLFLDEFQPVSTKMAKQQSMSLNPAKISGNCGRLMCCLRYEDEAYKELVKGVPKVGAFVETPAGYGTVVQINLLRQTVKVRLDGDDEDAVKAYGADEIAVIPGGRPVPGEQPPQILKFRAKPEPSAAETDETDFWNAPVMIAAEPKEIQVHPTSEGAARRKDRHRRGKGVRKPDKPGKPETEEAKPQQKTHPAQPKPCPPQQKPKEQPNKSAGKPVHHRRNKPRPPKTGE
jgi:cell fate regulator YaaT (PSP1 superfamily)